MVCHFADDLADGNVAAIAGLDEVGGGAGVEGWGRAANLLWGDPLTVLKTLINS